MVIFSHKEVADEIRHRQPLAFFIFNDDMAIARRGLHHIIRPQQAILFHDVIDNLTFIPNVIACGQHISPCR